MPPPPFPLIMQLMGGGGITGLGYDYGHAWHWLPLPVFCSTVCSGVSCSDITATIPRHVQTDSQWCRDLHGGHEECLQPQTHHSQEIWSQGMVWTVIPFRFVWNKFLIERSWVQVLAGAAGEFSSPLSTFCLQTLCFIVHSTPMLLQ